METNTFNWILGSGVLPELTTYAAQLKKKKNPQDQKW